MRACLTHSGPRPGVAATTQARLVALTQRHQHGVSLTGCSPCGVFARELARRAPAQGRPVITLGGPAAGEPGRSD